MFEGFMVSAWFIWNLQNFWVHEGFRSMRGFELQHALDYLEEYWSCKAITVASPSSGPTVVTSLMPLGSGAFQLHKDVSLSESGYRAAVVIRNSEASWLRLDIDRGYKHILLAMQNCSLLT